MITFKSVPSKAAIANLRDKIDIPTKRWDELLGAVNAQAFTVAGATQVSLLGDLHSAVNAAIQNGESIGSFRKRFDNVVALHGWEYKGKRGWRTRVIYDNNLRSAQMAGRWQQLQQTKKNRPYLIYNTVNDNRVRDEHRQWHHLVLKVDDVFWDTHYPPNGWGCRCSVRTANARQLERQGLKLDSPPSIETSERINAATGEIYGNVPKGIDTGWDFNVGKAWLGADVSLGTNLAALPTRFREAGLNYIESKRSHRQAAWQTWLKDRAADTKPRGYLFTVGHLSGDLFNAVSKVDTIKNTAIVISDKQLNHLYGQHKNKAKRFPDKWVNELPVKLANYSAVLEHNGDVVLVLPDKIDNKNGRIVVTLNFKTKGQIFNSIRSLGVVQLSNLKTREYKILEGSLK